jgi:hypothetical protein
MSPRPTPLFARLTLLGTLPLLALGACGGETERTGTDTPQVVDRAPLLRDSAGVHVRTHPAGALDVMWAVDPTPVVRLDGSQGGLEPFHLIASMTFESDSTFLLGEMAMTRLRRFTVGGDLLGTIGRPGEGPGEFGAMNALGFIGDSLVVFDSRWARISVFSPEREFVRTIALEPGEFGQRSRFQGLLADGRILSATYTAGTEPVWVIHDPSGRPLTEVESEIPPPELTMRLLGPGGGGANEPITPLLPVPRLVPVGQRLVSVAGDSWTIESLGLDGSLLAIDRIDLPVPAFTEPMRAAWRDRMETGLDPDNPNAEALRRMWAEAVMPEALPVLGGGRAVGGAPTVIEDDVGRLWVSAYSADDPIQTWLLFGQDRLQGQVELPEGMELHAVQGDLLLGVQLDDLGIQTAVIYRLGEAPPSMDRR